MTRIYLDHAATTPMSEEVIQVYTTEMKEEFGNPSSIHQTGRKARKKVDDARTILAKSIGAHETEITITSGGTEADNYAIFGTAYARKNEGKHVITTQIEHHAVLHACEQLEKDGFEVTYLPVDKNGLISINDLKNSLREDTILVSIMYANNEVGVIQPIVEIGEFLKDHPAYFHTDAVQAFGSLSIDVTTAYIDLLSVSSHKINGPKGIGFLYQRKGVNLKPIFYGGQQERKKRAGTENVPAIVAFAKAVQLKQTVITEGILTYNQLKQVFLTELERLRVPFKVNGSHESVLPHVINISIPNTDVETFLVQLDLAGIDASSGSACTAGSIDPSHVLVAMYGENTPELRNSVRFSFGLNNTKEQVIEAAYKISKIVL
ncbi:cysteine desulfurase family protein [Psychrobacillus psychrodurans]|uniref:cysteine desulfurase family protein n=1 Tax=Psychrobacillus psychrodurans TaxID=126157 RepID=UPI0008EE6BCB|nr:cysteine desulfurase family protein [Psychrobacillus psychrodurans]MCZ8541550.1 cysteine desulfurase [Psychrobacillus psychrodurans]SFN04170.1 cysteine desulfurase [Psychrobacillus psychrodurans]